MAKQLDPIQFGPAPASNTPCPHTPLPNAVCNACPPRRIPAPIKKGAR